MTGRTTIVAVIALTAAFGIGACGGDEESDEDQIRDVIALGNNKDPEICEKLTDKWMKDVVGGDRSDCEEQVKDTPKDAIEVKEVTVSGDKATVTADVQGDPGKLFLVKDGGDWKLDDIERRGS